MFRRGNDLEEAANNFRRAIALDPERGPYHHSLGVTLLDQGNPAQAIPSLERALTLVTDKVDRAFIDDNLGAALALTGNISAALKHMRAAGEDYTPEELYAWAAQDIAELNKENTIWNDNHPDRTPRPMIPELAPLKPVAR